MGASAFFHPAFVPAGHALACAPTRRVWGRGFGLAGPLAALRSGVATLRAAPLRRVSSGGRPPRPAAWRARPAPRAGRLSGGPARPAASVGFGAAVA